MSVEAILYVSSQIDHVLRKELSAAVEEIQITSGIVGLAFGRLKA